MTTLALPDEPHFNLEKSFRIGNINDSIELWQIGMDRLDEYSDVVHRTYSEFAAKFGRLPTRDSMHEAHLTWFHRAMYLATIGPQGMNGTGAGILLYDGSSYFVPEEFEGRADFEKLQSDYKAREIWIGTRNSVDSGMFARRGDPLRAMKAIINVGYGNILKRSNCLIFALVADNIYQRWRKMGYDWRLLPNGRAPHPLIEGLVFNAILLDTNRPWIKAPEA